MKGFLRIFGSSLFGKKRRKTNRIFYHNKLFLFATFWKKRGKRGITTLSLVKRETYPRTQGQIALILNNFNHPHIDIGERWEKLKKIEIKILVGGLCAFHEENKDDHNEEVEFSWWRFGNIR
jgi:hypothetical protein